MKKSFFITGTDTGIGKTYIACKLIKQYISQGYKVVGMKPVAAGCELVNGQWVNEDVALLTAASNVKAPTHLVNPYCFNAPIAPHIAAEQQNVVIDFNVIKQAYESLTKLADIVIVEGAGGVMVPLNQEKTTLDLITYLQIPATLVVGIKLGCINHTLLSYHAIKNHQIDIDGWVANCITPEMDVKEENIATLEKMLFKIKRLHIA